MCHNKNVRGSKQANLEVRMKLMVFDLDTALCQSSAMEGLALCQSVEDLTGEPPTMEAPPVFTHFPSAVASLLGREASQDELTIVRARFSVHLRRQMMIRSGYMDLNRRLIDTMNRMMGRRDTVVGLVSSCCSRVMKLKARSMGLVIDAVPSATLDDGEDLDDILNAIKTRVKRSYGFRFREATLVADAVWQPAAERSGFDWLAPSSFPQSGVSHTPTADTRSMA